MKKYLSLLFIFILLINFVIGDDRIQLRRGNAANWTSANPILAQGEIGVETDTNKFKIGDGVLVWDSLSYFTVSGVDDTTWYSSLLVYMDTATYKPKLDSSYTLFDSLGLYMDTATYKPKLDSSYSIFDSLGLKVDTATNTFTNLNDVQWESPTVGQIPLWGGTKLYNASPPAVVGSSGITLYLCDNAYITASAQSIGLYGLEHLPCSDTTEIDTVTVNVSDTYSILIERYYDTNIINNTHINAGTWTFNTYNAVNIDLGITTMPKVVYRVYDGTGTVTFSGTGTERQAVFTDSTLDSSMASLDKTLACALQTPNGIFQINNYVDDTTCTTATLSGYTNETTVSFSIHKWLFKSVGVEINNTTPTLNASQSVQQEFACGVNDRISAAYFAKTTRVGDVNVMLYHGDADYASHIVTPILLKHNDLSGIQGQGYYHLDSTIHNLFYDNDGDTTKYLRQDSTWSVPPGGAESNDSTFTIGRLILYPTSNADFRLWQTFDTIVITQLSGFVDSGTNFVGQLCIFESTGYNSTSIDTADVTFTTTNTYDTLFSSPIIYPYSWIGILATTVSGAVDHFYFTIRGYKQ